MNALFQTRAITCGCGRSLSVPVLGDVYSLVRESIEAEKREEADLLLKSALDEIDRLRAEIAEAQRDAERAATRLELTKRETTMLRNQRDELRLVLDKRPAMNAGLLEAYAAWSASVYALDWLDAGDDAMRKEGGE